MIIIMITLIIIMMIIIIIIATSLLQPFLRPRVSIVALNRLAVPSCV